MVPISNIKLTNPILILIYVLLTWLIEDEEPLWLPDIALLYLWSILAPAKEVMVSWAPSWSSSMSSLSSVELQIIGLRFSGLILAFPVALETEDKVTFEVTDPET